jgi:hypothetical protein
MSSECAANGALYAYELVYILLCSYHLTRGTS